MDYADQRYYASAYGRFNTADPYHGSASGANDPSTPLSWNKYAYSQNDPINFNDPRGLSRCDPAVDGFTGDDDDCGPDDDDGYFDNDGGDDGSGNPGGGGQPPTPPPCGSQRDVNYVITNFLGADAVSAQKGLSPEFILAWAAVESGFGTSGVSTTNDNYFGEKYFVCTNGGKDCVPNTNPDKSAPWKGAVPCSTINSTKAGFACFLGNNIYSSAMAALSSHGGAYLTAAKGALAGGVAAEAQAIADAGWCKEGNCPNGGYGQQVLADYNELVPVINCLFPWEGAQIALK